MSLRARVLAGMAVVAAVLVGVSVVLTLTTRDRLISQVDRRLASLGPGWVGHGPGPDFGPGGPEPPVPPSDTGAPERVSDVYQGVVDADGTLTTVFAPTVGAADDTPDLDGADLPASGTRLFTTSGTRSDTSYRVLARATGDGVAITAVSRDAENRTIDRLLVLEAGGALAILAVLGVVTWWVLRLGIRPIKAITESATRMADSDLSVRVEGSTRAPRLTSWRPR